MVLSDSKNFTEGREGRILLRSASYGGQEGSTTAAGGAHRAPSGTAGTGLSDPTLEPGGLRRLARRSAECVGGRRVLSPACGRTSLPRGTRGFVSFAAFCEVLNSAEEAVLETLKVTAFGTVPYISEHTFHQKNWL